MANQVHRPSDDEYWIEAWSRVLFSGDVFEAIPFGDQPTTLLTDEDAEPAKHYLGEVAFDPHWSPTTSSPVRRGGSRR